MFFLTLSLVLFDLYYCIFILCSHDQDNFLHTFHKKDHSAGCFRQYSRQFLLHFSSLMCSHLNFDLNHLFLPPPNVSSLLPFSVLLPSFQPLSGVWWSAHIERHWFPSSFSFISHSYRVSALLMQAQGPWKERKKTQAPKTKEVVELQRGKEGCHVDFQHQ